MLILNSQALIHHRIMLWTSLPPPAAYVHALDMLILNPQALTFHEIMLGLLSSLNVCICLGYADTKFASLAILQNFAVDTRVSDRFGYAETVGSMWPLPCVADRFGHAETNVCAVACIRFGPFRTCGDFGLHVAASVRFRPTRTCGD